MKEQTPLLAPCQRGAWPILRPLFDLSSNVETAQEIVKALDPFFYFTHEVDKGFATFSGHARRADAEDGSHPLLYVQVWRQGHLYRSFAFRGTGFTGILNIQCPPGHWLGFDHDYLESIFLDFSENCCEIPESTAAETLCLIEGKALILALPWAA